MKHNTSFTGLAQMLLFLMASVLLPVALLGCRTGPRPLRVFVASSFTAVAEDIAKEYAGRYPNTTVDINVAGSGTLVSQIQGGARADLIILASPHHMRQLQATSTVLQPTIVARNSLTIVLSPRLADTVTSVDDIRKGDFQIAICVVTAPCGTLALTYASSMKIDISGATREPNVKAVLAKVEGDEVDIGFVYVSDLQSTKVDLGHLDASNAAELSTSYHLAVTANSSRRQDAERFAALFAEEAGKNTILNFGFQLP